MCIFEGLFELISRRIPTNNTPYVYIEQCWQADLRHLAGTVVSQSPYFQFFIILSPQLSKRLSFLMLNKCTNAGCYMEFTRSTPLNYPSDTLMESTHISSYFRFLPTMAVLLV